MSPLWLILGCAVFYLIHSHLSSLPGNPAGSLKQRNNQPLKHMAKPRIEQNQDGSVTVRLRNVRLSFPALFKPRSMEAGKEPTHQATFLMLRQNDPENNLALMKQGIDLVVKAGLKGVHPGPDRVCLQSGKQKGERGIDGYSADIAYVSSNSKKRPVVVDRDLTPLTGEDGRPYGGCYVNATVRLWAQDGVKNPQWGRRVNAQLRAVQFFADGEPFGESSVDANEEFAAEEGGGAGSADDLL